MDKIKEKKIVIVSHKLYHGVGDDLIEYLIKNKCGEFYYIGHEFEARKTRKSYIQYYYKGKKKWEKFTPDFKVLPEIVIYFKDLIVTLIWLVVFTKKIDIYFGFGGINVLPSLVLKKNIKIDKIIFYTIDFVPNRFNIKLLNSIYLGIDKLAVKYSNEVWNLSPRMSKARQKYLNLNKKLKNKQKVVPVGVWLEKIKKQISNIKSNPKEVIFVGHLLEKQGIQIMLQSIPQISKEIPNLKFTIIGSGEYEKVLKRMVKKLEIEKFVKFEGPIYDKTKLNKKLAKATLGLAMYDKKTDTFTYYADPTKLKTYMACGLPVVMTDIPYNAKDIEANNCGKIVNYNSKDLSKEIINLLRNENKINNYKKSTQKYMLQYDWNNIFDKNIKRLV